MFSLHGLNIPVQNATRAMEGRNQQLSISGSPTALVDHPRSVWTFEAGPMPLHRARGIRRLTTAQRWDFSQDEVGSNGLPLLTTGTVYISAGRLTVNTASTATLQGDFSADACIVIAKPSMPLYVIQNGDVWNNGAIITQPSWLTIDLDGIHLGGPGQFHGAWVSGPVPEAFCLELSRIGGSPVSLYGSHVSISGVESEALVTTGPLSIDQSLNCTFSMEVTTND